jgi:hypothetical protein
VLLGRNRQGQPVWFVRCYHVADTFKDAARRNGTFCGRPILEWLAAAGASPEQVWDAAVPESERSLWNARVFPAVRRHAEYRDWLWMFDAAAPTDRQRRAFLAADRSSAAEIAFLADQDAFYAWRTRLRAEQMPREFRRLFRPESTFSAGDLGYLLAHAPDRAAWIAGLLDEAKFHSDAAAASPSEKDAAARILHSLASALDGKDVAGGEAAFAQFVPALDKALSAPTREWLDSLGLAPGPQARLTDWARRAKTVALSLATISLPSDRAGDYLDRNRAIMALLSTLE